jgi:hypothetical protein
MFIGILYPKNKLNPYAHSSGATAITLKLRTGSVYIMCMPPLKKPK